MIKKCFYILLTVCMLNACGSCGNRGSSSDLEVPDTLMYSDAIIPDDEISGFIDNMSSPVEMAALIKSLDVKFSNKYLASTDNVEDFSTEYQQALNLGIYGLDLGYLNMYNKTNAVLDYISAIKTLADGINVGQFFDFATLRRLSQNDQNLDSLMYISVHSFNQMDRYLRKNKRSNLSVLMITGVWIEGNYLVTQVYKEVPHPELKEKIGEQKIVLDKLMLFLEVFKNDKQLQAIANDLKPLKEQYKDITITIQKGEPQAIEKDGTLVFIQNDVSIVNITDEQVKSIIAKTEEVRNKLISK